MVAPFAAAVGGLFAKGRSLAHCPMMMSLPSLPSSRTPAQTSFRPDIEGLRAVAVLFVVLFHADLGHCSGRVRRCRRLLRPVGLPDHRAAAPRTPADGHDLSPGVLRAPRPTAAAGGDARPRGHAARLDRPVAATAGTRRRGRCGGRGGLRVEHGLRAPRDRLFRGGAGALTAAPLLVARRGGAVLPVLAGAGPARRTPGGRRASAGSGWRSPRCASDRSHSRSG